MATSRKTKTSAKASTGAAKKTKKSSGAAKTGAAKKSPAKTAAKRSASAKKTEKASQDVTTKPTKKVRTKKPAATKETVEKAPKAAKPAKPARPAKPAVDPELLKTIREALVSQRNQLLNVVHSTQAQLAEKETGLADVSDRASGGFEDELAMGLMRIEAAQIEDIEAAIERIDVGTYGVCVDCGKVIPRKRLEVLPFAQRCLDCEGTKERRARMQSLVSDDGDSND